MQETYIRKVSGSLSSVFGDILQTDKDRTEFESLIIGKPIKNENDRVIGKITDILWDEDLWIGEVYLQLRFENNATATITYLEEKEETSMIFNPWRKYPKRKPKESGHYLCTVGVWDGDDYRLVITKLYFMVRDGKDKWIDLNRQSVFDGYKVYGACRAPIEENRVWTDGLCNRTDNVIAWKKLPKCWRARKGKKK